MRAMALEIVRLTFQCDEEHFSLVVSGFLWIIRSDGTFLPAANGITEALLLATTTLPPRSGS